MGRKVMVIGGINADITGFSEKRAVMDDSNPGRIEISAGGVGRNIGENLVRTGFQVGMLTALARDAMGAFLTRHCREIGIDLSGSLVQDDMEGRTSIYLSAVDSDGEMLTAVSDMAILEQLVPGHLLHCRSQLEAADYIIVDANLSIGMLRAVLGEYGRKRIVVDPVSTGKARKLIGLKGAVELIKPNLKEAEILVGKPLDSRERIIGALKFLNASGARWALLTDGKRGAWLSGEGRIAYCPSPEAAKKNVNGAGDAFLAGAVYGHEKNLHPEDMLLYGHGAGSIAMESAETVNPAMTAELLEKRTKELKRCLKVEWI